MLVGLGHLLLQIGHDCALLLHLLQAFLVHLVVLMHRALDFLQLLLQFGL